MSLRTFRVTVTTANARVTYRAIAKSWYYAWLSAFEEFGRDVRIFIRPIGGKSCER
jgi:hypothetical protein